MKMSVVIPAYNAEKYIEYCVDSVFTELLAIFDDDDFEILVVNDGSTDKTLDLLENKKNYMPQLKIFNQTNSGPSVARNKGLENACGEYVALNDADDEWIHGKLKKQLDFLNANEDVDLVCSIYGEKSKYKDIFEITFKKECFHNYYSPQTSVFKSKIAKNYRFNESQKYSEDMRFFLEILQENKCVFLPVNSTKNIHGKANFGESGLSSKLWQMEKGELSNLNYIFKTDKISFPLFFISIIYSYIKYVRRLFYTFIRKIHKKLK